MRWIGVAWVVGALLPVVALTWALADGATIGPGPFWPSLVFLVSYSPLAYLGASLAMGPAPAPIAWVMLAVAGSNAIVGFAGQYAVHGLLVDPGSLPGALTAAVVASLGGVPNVLAGAVLLPMVPTGRLPGGRARWLVIAGLGVGGVAMCGRLLAEGELALFAGVANPLGVPGAATIATVGVLWPVCVGAIGVWLMRRGDRLLTRIGWLAIAISASSTVFALLGRPDLIWISALTALVLLAEVTLVTSRSERLWGLPTLMHRTALWLVLASALALGYGAAVGVVAALGSELEGMARWAALAAAVAAAAAVRAALGGWARRAIVGEGEDPARAVARLRARLDASNAPQALVEAAAAAVRASHVTLDVFARGALVRAAEAGAADPGSDRFALVLPGGVLAVTLPHGEHLPAAERDLLRDLCALAAPALRVWGPIGLDLARLDAIADALRDEPDAAALERIHGEVGGLLEEVRALARELT